MKSSNTFIKPEIKTQIRQLKHNDESTFNQELGTPEFKKIKIDNIEIANPDTFKFETAGKIDNFNDD